MGQSKNGGGVCPVLVLPRVILWFLVLWFFGPMVPGPLVLWSLDPMVPGSYGPGSLVPGPLVLVSGSWSLGPMVLVRFLVLVPVSFMHFLQERPHTLTSPQRHPHTNTQKHKKHTQTY